MGHGRLHTSELPFTPNNHRDNIEGAGEASDIVKGSEV